MELVIVRFTNPKQKIESEISQKFVASSILFLIYISGVLSTVENGYLMSHNYYLLTI